MLDTQTVSAKSHKLSLPGLQIKPGFAARLMFIGPYIYLWLWGLRSTLQ